MGQPPTSRLSAGKVFHVLDQELTLIEERHPEDSKGRTVWTATWERNPGDVHIVEFALSPPDWFVGGQDSGHRKLATLQDDDGWQRTALITRLPCPLPEPYGHIKLIDFLGMGGMGVVWAAESRDHLDLPVAVKFTAFSKE